VRNHRKEKGSGTMALTKKNIRCNHNNITEGNGGPGKKSKRRWAYGQVGEAINTETLSANPRPNGAERLSFLHQE